MGSAGGTGNDNGASKVTAKGAAGSRAGGRSPHVAQGILLGGAAAQLILALLTTVFLARVLTPAAFGFFSLVGTIFILARDLLDIGLGSVAARDIARDARRERPILEGMMAYRRIAGVVLALVLAGFAVVHRAGPERMVLLGVAVVLLFTEPAALEAVFQVRQAQGGPALLTIFGGLLVLGGSVLFARAGVAGALFASLLVAREAFSLLGTKVLAERLLGYRPKPGFGGRELKAFVRPAFFFALASVVYIVYFHCDVFFVLALRGKDELGAYASAFRPINPLIVLPWLLMAPLIPVLSAAAARDTERFVRQVQGIAALALGIGACAAVAGSMLAPDLVQLLYKGRYLHGALSSVNAFRWLALAVGQVCVSTVLMAALLAAKREKLVLAIGTTGLVVNAGLNFALLTHYNFTAAAFATALSEFLFFTGAMLGFQITAGRAALRPRELLYLGPALVMSLVLAAITSNAAVRVGCGLLLGSASVIGLLATPRARSLRQELSAEQASTSSLLQTGLMLE